MKNFPAAFAAQKNLTTGASPVWILRFLVGEATTYDLSDNEFAITPWGSTTKKWVRDWGEIREGLGGLLEEFRVSEFSLDLLVDPGESPNMETLLLTYALESSPVSLYLWFHGCADPPREIFRGHISESEFPDETSVRLTVQDASLRLERAMIGEVVTTERYPFADPDDVGKLVPVPFGTVQRLPALSVHSGVLTSLPYDITATSTDIAVAAEGLTPSTIIQIDAEEIYIVDVSGAVILDCVRGVNGTVAAPHRAGAVVWERKAAFDYLVSQIPLQSIPKVRAVLGDQELDITSACTRYTGQPGNEHPSYPGKGVVSVSGSLASGTVVSLLAADGVSPTDTSYLTETVGLQDGVVVSDVVSMAVAAHQHEGVRAEMPFHPLTLQGANVTNLQNCADNDMSSYAVVNAGGNIQAWDVTGSAYPSNPTRIRGYVYSGRGGSAMLVVNGVNKNAVALSTAQGFSYTDWEPFTSWVDLISGNIKLRIECSAGSMDAYDIGFIVEGESTAGAMVAVVNRSGSASKNVARTKLGGVSLGGAESRSGSVVISGSVARTLIADQILCDVVSTVSSIPDVYAWLLSAAGSSAAFRQIGAWPAYYAFNGAITELHSALYWLNELAFQARAWFRFAAGEAQLIYRAGSVVPVKTLASCKIEGGKRAHSRKLTSYDEVVNEITLRYDRDWSLPRGDSGYRSAVSGEDTASVERYGHRRRDDLFMFDFVNSPEMAQDLLAFYLAWHAQRHWVHTFSSFLYDSELEFADGVTLGFAGDRPAWIMETGFSPGDSRKSDYIGLVAIE